MTSRHERAGMHVTRIMVTNQIVATDYSEDGGNFSCHTGVELPVENGVPFSVDVELIDPEVLREAMERSNPPELIQKSGGRLSGPGFPTILVGPNGGGKSVSISMIDTFFKLIGEIYPLADEISRSDIHFGMTDDWGEIWSDLCSLDYYEYRRVLHKSKPNSHVIERLLSQFSWLGGAWKSELSVMNSRVRGLGIGDPEIEFIESKFSMEVRKSHNSIDQVRISFVSETDSNDPTSGYVMILNDKWSELNGSGNSENGNVFLFPSTTYRVHSGVRDKFLPLVVGPENPNGAVFTENRLKKLADLFVDVSDVASEAMDQYDFDGDESSEEILASSIGELFHLRAEYHGHHPLKADLRKDARGVLQGFLEAIDPVGRRSLMSSREPSQCLLVDTQRTDLSTGEIKTPSHRTASKIGRAIAKTLGSAQRDLDTKTEISRFNDAGVNARRNPKVLEDLMQEVSSEGEARMIEISELISQFTESEFDPRDEPCKYIFGDREYDSYPPFKLSSEGLAETILSNRLIEAVDEFGVAFSEEGSEKREIESFLYEREDSSSWYEIIEDSEHLSVRYDMVFEWWNMGLRIEHLQELFEMARGFSLDSALTRTGLVGEILKAFDLHDKKLDFEDVLFSMVSHALRSLREYAAIGSRLRSMSSKMSDFLEMEVSINPDGIGVVVEDMLSWDPGVLQERLEIPYLSSGQAQLFTILSEMELASTDVGVFLIDEPELSLHDKFVADLYDYLCEFSTSSGKQVICSTHSTTLAGMGLMSSVFVEGQGESIEQ